MCLAAPLTVLMPGGTLPMIDISEIEKRNYGTPFSSMYTPKNLITNPRKFLLFEIFKSGRDAY
jgi:hypothetical protein